MNAPEHIATPMTRRFPPYRTRNRDDILSLFRTGLSIKQIMSWGYARVNIETVIRQALDVLMANAQKVGNPPNRAGHFLATATANESV